MKTLLGILVALSLTMPAYADDLQVNGHEVKGLTPSQIADLQAQATKLAEQNNQQPQPSKTADIVKQVGEYTQLGQALGSGLATAAKELGMAVNEFANTPIGKVATFIIVFKLVGKEFISMGVGLLWLFTMIPFWTYFFRRMCLVKARVSEQSVDDKGKVGKVVKRTEYFDDPPDEIHVTRFFMLVVLAAIVLVGLLLV